MQKLFTITGNHSFLFYVLFFNFDKSPHPMTQAEFRLYNDQPCRFRMKSGKEVFGVIWEKPQSGNTSYYFASLSERYNRSQRNNSIGMMINIEDVVGAELLSNSGTLVG
jgi:hypothetical protein